MTEITIELEEITPEKAYEYLGHNIKNRHMNEQVVIRMARDIASGNWEINGETIKFDTNGVLLDGQHRLTAIATANVTCSMFVARGLDPKNWETIDTGAKRTFANVLQHREEKNASVLGAIARAVAAWKEGRRGYFPVFTNAELARVLDEEPSLRDGVQTASKASSVFGIGVSIPGVCWWLFNQIDGEMNERFWARLFSEYEHTKGDPVSTLRRKLLSGDELIGSGTTPKRAFTMAIIIKAWNAYRKGKSIQVLKYQSNGEAFPEPK